MIDPIDREALIDDLLQEDYTTHRFCFPCKLIFDAIRKQPSIEPKKGTWIDNGDFWENCSVCGCEVTKNAYDSLLRYTEHYNFCPNCGADMRGEEE